MAAKEWTVKELTGSVTMGELRVVWDRHDQPTVSDAEFDNDVWVQTHPRRIEIRFNGSPAPDGLVAFKTAIKDMGALDWDEVNPGTEIMLTCRGDVITHLPTIAGGLDEHIWIEVKEIPTQPDPATESFGNLGGLGGLEGFMDD